LNRDNSKENRDISITRWDLFKVFLSSFFLQAVWNFRGLLSIGFSTCLFPIIKKLYSDTNDKKQFFRRHLLFFNAHPYFASFALGVSIRLEEMSAKGEPHIPEVLKQLKDLLISPLGAVGDRLFWATIKPACLTLGVIGILLAPNLIAELIVLLLVFIIYNIPHFYFRYQGILEGYKYGREIYKYVSQQRFETLRKIYVYIFLFSFIALIAAYSIQLFDIQIGLVVVFLLSIFYMVFFNKIVKNFYLSVFATTTFFMVVGILFF
jgi:PTS system mannose-specific IID component